MNWQLEHDAILLELEKVNASCADIAKALMAKFGEHLNVTKNAVIGRRHRLGLQRPREPQPVNGHKAPRPRKPKASKRRPPVPRSMGMHTKLGKLAMLKHESPPTIENGISLLDLEPHHCRAVIGNGPDGFARFCGNQRLPMIDANGYQVLILDEPAWESSWCPHHKALYVRSS